MKRPTRGQWILLWSGAVCVLAALLIADQYVQGLAVAGVVAVGLLCWRLGIHAGMPSDGARADDPGARKQSAMLDSTHDWLMTLRPMSQLVRMFVIPEIERRVSTGTLLENVLPFQLVQFRWIQAEGRNIIELNEEVKLRARIKTTRPVEAGQPLTLADIEPNECYLEGPAVDGKPAAFYLSRSTFLNFMNVFDFTPNAPAAHSAEPAALTGIRYPIAEIAQAEAALNAMRPIEKYKQLSDANWPPGPAFYPAVLWQVHSHPGSLAQAHFGDIVAQSYNEKYLRERLDFWSETKFFGDRFVYVKKSIDEYLDGDYISAIYVLVPQFEGIIKDYLAAAAGLHRYRLESCVQDLKSLVLSRKVLMFPRPVLDIIFAFLEDGPFLTETTNIRDPAVEVTRHGIAHGRFIGFENRDIALKYIVLLDSLAYVMLHDKLLGGTL